MSDESTRIHTFYVENKCRLAICPGDHKHPNTAGYPHSELYAADILPTLSDRYCWLLDHDHLCLDIDVHEGGADGMAALGRLCDKIGVDLRKRCGAILQTPTGGVHLYFKKPEDLNIRSLASIDSVEYAGIDTLSRTIRNNALVIGAGSTHPTADGRYEWLTPQPVLFDTPPALLELLTERKTLREVLHKPGVASTGTPGDAFTRSWEGVEFLAQVMSAIGYTFRRTAEGETGVPYYEFRRPDKTTASALSGFLGKKSQDGNHQLCSFSHSDPFFQPAGESMTILEALVRLKNEGKGRDGEGGEDRYRLIVKSIRSHGFGEISVEGAFAGMDEDAGFGDVTPPADDVGGGTVAPAAAAAVTDELPTFSNFAIDVNADGKEVRIPRTMPWLVDQLVGKGWPKLCAGTLFVRRGESVGAIKTCNSLFAWMEGMVQVRWFEGCGMVTKAEFFEAVLAAAEEVEMIASTPHFPPIDGVFYTNSVAVGLESDFWQFVDLFNPSSDQDRLLMAAAILTPFWGIAGGKRPAIVVTSPDHAGSGKSTFVEAIARLAGNGESSKLTIASQADFDKIGEKLAQTSAMDPQAARVVVIDNFRGTTLGRTDIESYLTEDKLSVRKMYVGTIKVQNLFTWFATGNAMVMSEDMSQRSVQVSIRKPAAYSADWTRKLRDWPVEKVLGGIAAMFQRTPVPAADATRFDEWCSEVLARVVVGETEYADLLDHLRGGVAELSVQTDDVGDFRTVLSRYRAYRLETEPAWDGFFQTSQMAETLTAMGVMTPFGKRWNARYLSQRLKEYLQYLPEVEEARSPQPVRAKGYRFMAE